MRELYLFAFIALSLAPFITAQPWYVSPGATGNGSQANPFGNISIAFSTATTGQTIILGAGTYRGTANINLNLQGRALTITGQGWRNTIIDCEQSVFSAFLAQTTNSALTLSGVSIVNCYRNAVILRSTSSHSITSCYFSGHQTTTNNGGAISVSSGTVTISNSTFENNQYSAIWSDTGSLTVVNSRFTFNTPSVSTQGGAITISGSGSGSITNNVFISNAGAISTGSGPVTISANRFYNNSNTFTVQCTTPTTVSHSGNSFCGPNGITNNCGNLTGYQSYFDGCLKCRGMNEDKDCNGVCWGPNTNCQTPQSVKVPVGGNIQNAINSINTYKGEIILAKGTYSGTGNVNLNFGGKAITLKSRFSDPFDVTIDCQGTGSAFVVNQKESFDTVIEGITMKNCASSAIVLSGGSGLTVSRSILTANSRISNPGGGAILVTDSFLVIQNSSLNNNRGEAGGGAIYIRKSSLVSWVYAYETQFIDNQSGRFGGAINMEDSNQLEVRNSYFIRNSADPTFTGGAINTRVTDGGILIISGTSFFNNSYAQTAGTKETVYCGAITNFATVTFDVTNGNSFCSDSNSNVVNCGGWAPTFGAVVDICGVCNGAGKNLDCNGTCFGYGIRDAAGDCCRRSEGDCQGYCLHRYVEDVPSSVNGLPVCCANSSVSKDRQGLDVCCLSPNTTDVCGICGGNGQCCPVQCKNGGTCSGTTCNCINGWSGNDCSVNAIGCPQGCVNGICVAPLQCQCYDSNDQSSNCAGSEDCGSVTCLNGGVCANSTTETCNCTVNWYGTNCSSPVCSPACANGGRCAAPYYCLCPTGWTGETCTNYYCSPPCLNGGTCSGPSTCTCPQNYSGPRCNVYTGPIEGESESYAEKVIATLFVLVLALLL